MGPIYFKTVEQTRQSVVSLQDQLFVRLRPEITWIQNFKLRLGNIVRLSQKPLSKETTHTKITCSWRIPNCITHSLMKCPFSMSRMESLDYYTVWFSLLPSLPPFLPAFLSSNPGLHPYHPTALPLSYIPSPNCLISWGKKWWISPGIKCLRV